MKFFTSLLVLISCFFCLNGCKSLDTNEAYTNRPLIKGPMEHDTPAKKQENEILSKEYVVAQRALDKAVLEKDKRVIKMGLENSILAIRLRTAEAILEINDETFVPNLIEALERNQSVLEGGTEIRILQSKLDTTLTAALETITKIKFEISESPSADEIDKVIRESREWWKKTQRNT